MNKSKQAFTMIELVFVIVVLGILASIAIPRFAATRTDAEITKGIADVASIRSAIISERQGRLIAGDSNWITIANLGTGFSGVLMYPIVYGSATQNGHWRAGTATGTTSMTYIFRISANDNTFTYTPADGKFLCTSGNNCSDLTN